MLAGKHSRALSSATVNHVIPAVHTKRRALVDPFELAMKSSGVGDEQGSPGGSFYIYSDVEHLPCAIRALSRGTWLIGPRRTGSMRDRDRVGGDGRLEGDPLMLIGPGRR